MKQGIGHPAVVKCENQNAGKGNKEQKLNDFPFQNFFGIRFSVVQAMRGGILASFA